MQKKLYFSGLIIVALIGVTLTVMAQNGTLPFVVNPEEQGNHDGNHQFPQIAGSIKVDENYSGNLTSLATVSKQQAQDIALAYTTGGAVTTCTIDNENGFLVWNVDVNFNGTLYQIMVDAGNGDVLWASQGGAEGSE